MSITSKRTYPLIPQASAALMSSPNSLWGELIGKLIESAEYVEVERRVQKHLIICSRFYYMLGSTIISQLNKLFG
ncbi:hypothetical protein BCR33DRAFT_713106 [Rhizoclosmatium globosum]|uniref:Uncharacterized protein n=1 Tax=Rhizoclosmatium globosum TaxID=329046 RepID=A0A1Y2CTV9_9FUNG|nr:hypothetical protein BCR33DRAFT_713106 [Rhizoclosmatium globosum]|eukprot:ORY50274.1 hypothetical protein BCR33DRAFT_713106 [Rhizoclosmatium globosum]